MAGEKSKLIRRYLGLLLRIITDPCQYQTDGLLASIYAQPLLCLLMYAAIEWQ